MAYFILSCFIVFVVTFVAGNYYLKIMLSLSTNLTQRNKYFGGIIFIIYSLLIIAGAIIPWEIAKIHKLNISVFWAVMPLFVLLIYFLIYKYKDMQTIGKIFNSEFKNIK